jgi:glycerol uptake operon antiterminator
MDIDKHNILSSFERAPIVAAIRSEEQLEAALQSKVQNIFILNADILNVGSMVGHIQESGRNAILHIDLVEGLGRDGKAVDFIVNNIKPDGIITTRTTHIKHLVEKTFVIQRIFMIDNQSFETGIKTVKNLQPDMVEIMPGIIPQIISNFTKSVSVPVIAGGLVATKEDVIAALRSGAICASTGKADLWDLE